MAVLTIRDFDESLKAKLRVRAAEHGRSMDAEVCAILASVLTRSETGPGMASRMRQRFADVSFEPPRRTERARAVELPE